MKRTSLQPGASERGAALVIVLLLLAILTVLLAEFVYEQRVQTALLKNHEAKVQALYVARAGQNAARGLVTRSSPDNAGVYNNDFIQLYRYQCISAPATAALGLTTGQEQQQQQQLTDISTMEGCGLWSLSLPYALEDAPLDLEIYDEQARINLNAMFKLVPSNPQDPNAGTGDNLITNENVANVVFELFRYEALKHNIQLSDADLYDMIHTDLMDYIDHDTVDGSMDKDRDSYFEYQNSNAIVPLKNAWLDSVDEIRLLPGMTDDLYNAVKDYLTVYPVDAAGSPSPLVDLNAAPVEVIYALIRGASYDHGQPTISEDEAMQDAMQIVTGAANSGSQQTANTAGQNPQQAFIRNPPPALANNSQFTGMEFNTPPAQNTPRFWRVVSTALTQDGMQTVITRVVKVDRINNFSVLYYRED